MQIHVHIHVSEEERKIESEMSILWRVIEIKYLFYLKFHFLIKSLTTRDHVTFTINPHETSDCFILRVTDIVQDWKKCTRSPSLPPQNLTMIILFDTALKQNCQSQHFDRNDSFERFDISALYPINFISIAIIISHVLFKNIFSFVNPPMCRSSILIRHNEFIFTCHCALWHGT